jgi:Domain of unknown function (DUF1851)
MAPKWSDLTFTPDADAVAALRSSWAWLLPARFSPLLFSTMGDVFFTAEQGDVYWLNTGLGKLSRVADSDDHFRQLLATERVEEWFLPALIKELHECGKHLSPGRCYTFAILPIFAEGRYEPSNLNAVPAREHFALTGDVHRQLQSLQDGAKVKLSVVP